LVPAGGSSPAQFGAILIADVERVRKVVTGAGIKREYRERGGIHDDPEACARHIGLTILGRMAAATASMTA
jgi:hypothetical protein